MAACFAGSCAAWTVASVSACSADARAAEACCSRAAARVTVVWAAATASAARRWTTVRCCRTSVRPGAGGVEQGGALEQLPGAGGGQHGLHPRRGAAHHVAAAGEGGHGSPGRGDVLSRLPGRGPRGVSGRLRAAVARLLGRVLRAGGSGAGMRRCHRCPRRPAARSGAARPARRRRPRPAVRRSAGRPTPAGPRPFPGRRPRPGQWRRHPRHPPRPGRGGRSRTASRAHGPPSRRRAIPEQGSPHPRGRSARCGTSLRVAYRGRPARPAPAPGSAEVEPVEVHHLVPRGDEVAHELLLRVVGGVDLGDARAAAEFEPKTRSTAVAVHLTSPVARSRPS